MEGCSQYKPKFFFFITFLTLCLSAGCVQSGVTSSQLRSFAVKSSEPRPQLVDPSATPSPILPLPYLSVVQKYSKDYGVDWTLVLAMMKQESRFNHRAVSRRGAYGLMQLMPETQIEISGKLGFHDFTRPKNNIRAGIFHLKGLFESFSEASESDRVRLVLAAYNAGLGRVNDAQGLVRRLGGNPNNWSDVRTALTMLSPRYATLHKTFWNGQPPTAGYFRDWKQTLQYVDAVVRYQERFDLAEMRI